MRLAIGLVLALASSVALAEHYGAPIDASKQAVSLENAIAQVGKAQTANVVVESKVDKVCTAKGCWLGLVSKNNDLHVTFDEKFFVPQALIGKTVRVAGTIEKVTMTLEETKHYVKDAGGDPSKVTAPKTTYQMTATGVETVG
jgi:hypothetical protein